MDAQWRFMNHSIRCARPLLFEKARPLCRQAVASIGRWVCRRSKWAQGDHCSRSRSSSSSSSSRSSSRSRS
eukprot:5425913-Alexandrium_andersonii.AAC.1